MSEINNESCEIRTREDYKKDRKGNVMYYVEAFKRLDETRKYTWNWAAFFFGFSWMFYRKMYLYGIAFCWIIDIVALVVLDRVVYLVTGVPFFSPELLESSSHLKNDPFVVLTEVYIVVTLAERIFCGYFGNTLYYRIVKNRIHKGYHLLSKYSPKSVTSGISSNLGILICFADWISRKQQLKNKAAYEVNEETIRAYLNPARKIPGVVKVANTIVWLLFIVFFIGSRIPR